MSLVWAVMADEQTEFFLSESHLLIEPQRGGEIDSLVRSFCPANPPHQAFR